MFVHEQERIREKASPFLRREKQAKYTFTGVCLVVKADARAGALACIYCSPTGPRTAP